MELVVKKLGEELVLKIGLISMRMESVGNYVLVVQINYTQNTMSI